jgi:inositol hexakisphosphate/diphosphoinositol-pentakisphosphate kinase
MILNEEVEMWPECDVLIAFYSSGYPLEKAEKYAELHPEMYVINDLKMQHELKDRRRVYDLLKASGIDVPRHVFLNRDGYVSRTSVNNLFNRNNDDTSSMIQSQNLTIGDDEDETELIENDDNIIVNGVTISKPFVEKPVDADDHNIAIYYPYSAGGGCKKLFRKVMNRSSEFYPEINEVRRDGSYIYEEYVETQGIDVKTYTVGSGYVSQSGHSCAILSIFTALSNNYLSIFLSYYQ